MSQNADDFVAGTPATTSQDDSAYHDPLVFRNKHGEQCWGHSPPSISGLGMQPPARGRGMGDQKRFTLEELAEATGMTPRNVRAYQTRGLIPRPIREGRRSVYGPDHVRQITAIQRARAEGASLELLSGVVADGGNLNRNEDSWLPGSRAHRSHRQARQADLQPLLTRLGSGRTAAVQQLVEQLTAMGLIRQKGGRTLVGRDLATGMTALRRQGFPPQAVVAVALHTALATAPLIDILLQLLDEATGGMPNPAAAGHTADLAASIVRDALAARLVPPGE
jgi:DNA-binding transcriptional MerR regulator